MTRPALACVVFLSTLTACVATCVAACGRIADDAGGASRDAGSGEGATNGPPDGGGSPDALAPKPDSGLPEKPRCDGGTTTTSPNGGACDSSRLVNVHRWPSETCIAKGDFCDTLLVGITEDQLSKVPAGFKCDKPDRGYVQCEWPLGPDRRIDDAALDAACAATVALPDVRVECIIFD
jgi:hypothetical protein